jgi:3'-phosphoadenosine 5'-phosphosulfate sulfotransferase (PAPS reductase)/FAD synthetase
MNPQTILTNAILKWQPKSLVSLYSGGYDSAVTTHLLHTLDTHGLPIQVAAIDTQLAADGWREYVQSVADNQGWDFKIYKSDKAWSQFLTLVIHKGCPKSRKMHTYVFQKLKGRIIEAIHMDKKSHRNDKTLFISGMRRAESPFRKEAAEVDRIGHSNRIFAAPIVHWSQEDCDLYRIENGLPDNPFYGTVKGSGDCQCNWGDFITLDTLRKHSPKLAGGNVALIDKLSRDLHGFGWDSRDVVAQPTLIPRSQEIEDAKLTTPFLCQGCSRAKVRAPTKAVEEVMLQRGLF